MKNQEYTLTKKSWPYFIMVIIGVIFNLLALFKEDSGSLVAVGCSLIVIGLAAARRVHHGE
ncbi:MAG: hypothetical protein KDC57_00795 [Saprospiraceae bacterium]|nr:hypothetical protein [Saprospiraceae bacterium]